MRKINIPKEILEDLYCVRGMTLKEIADEFGVNRQTIANKMNEFGLSIHNSAYIRAVKEKKKSIPHISKKKPDYQIKSVFQRAYSSIKSIDGVAEYFDINVKTAFEWKKRHNIATIHEYSQSGRKKINSGKPYTNKEWLESMYEKYSWEDLAKMLNCSPTTLSKWGIRFGIKTRTHSEQWDLKAKYGSRIVKPGEFDLQLYKETYSLDQSKLPKGVKQFIVDLYGKCECCGYSEVLDLHHIDEDRTNNDPENHSVLCPNCHAKIHRLGIKFEELVPDHVSWDKLLEDSYQEAK